MERIEALNKKRNEILSAIKPICEAFKINDYDYIVSESGQREILRIGSTQIGCSCNSVDAVITELVGYIFIAKWCRYRTIGAFDTQTKNVIKRYWIKANE